MTLLKERKDVKDVCAGRQSKADTMKRSKEEEAGGFLSRTGGGALGPG